MSAPCGGSFSIAGCAGCPLRDCDEAMNAIANAVRNSDFEMSGRDAVAIVALLGAHSESQQAAPDGKRRRHLTLVGA